MEKTRIEYSDKPHANFAHSLDLNGFFLSSLRLIERRCRPIQSGSVDGNLKGLRESYEMLPKARNPKPGQVFGGGRPPYKANSKWWDRTHQESLLPHEFTLQICRFPLVSYSSTLIKQPHIPANFNRGNYMGIDNYSWPHNDHDYLFPFGASRMMVIPCLCRTF